jgi:hypothetical protein
LIWAAVVLCVVVEERCCEEVFDTKEEARLSFTRTLSQSSLSEATKVFTVTCRAAKDMFTFTDQNRPGTLVEA